MRELTKTGSSLKSYYKSIFLYLLFSLVLSPNLFSQSVSVVNNLNFGTFKPGLAGGSLTLNTSNAISSVSGSIVIISSLGVSSLRLTVVAPSGGGPRKTIQSITFNGGNSITLQGNNGGTLTFTFGNPLINGVSRTLPFQVNRGSTNTIIYGGTLTVGGTGSNPDGTYTRNPINVVVTF